MHMFEYTSQVIAHEREAEIVRAAEQRRAGLERLAASAAPATRAGAPDRGPAPAGAPRGALRSVLRRALRPTVHPTPHRALSGPGPVSVDRGTMAG